MYKKARRVAGRVKRRYFVKTKKPYIPSFSEHELIHALQGYIEPEADFPSRSQGDSTATISREDVATYFSRTERRPSFFVAPTRVAELASDMSRLHPQWRERLLRQTTSERTQGLQIFSVMGPPLKPGFAWGELPDGSNGDDLYGIRPHRFAFAPRHVLAVVYDGASTGDIADILEDWMRYVALGKSEMPYASALVVIQRLLALSWAHAFAMALPCKGDPDVVRLQFDILRILRADIQFLLPILGQSPPNNHLLADLFGAWYIRLLFPEFVPGPVDLAPHEHAWLAELERQVYADGTGFEPALHYHEFGCEMAAAYLLLSRRNSRRVPAATLLRIERMLDFQASLAGPNDLTVPFGDATEDPLFPLDCGDGWATAALRELYRALFRPECSPAPPSTPSVERAFWLLGGELAPSQNQEESTQRTRSARYWPNGGIGIFRDDTVGLNLVFRTGPAEHAHLAAGHMHADLLSICVSSRTQPILTDPGTMTYRHCHSSVTPGRSYFSGPAAHNGLSFGSIDPLGAVVGDFRKRDGVLSRVRTTHTLLGGGLAWLEAEIRGNSVYNGYRRGIVHVQGFYWIIYDWLPQGLEEHVAVYGFQAAPEARVEHDEDGIQWLHCANESIWLSRGPGLEAPEQICGQSDPPGGWVAPRYGELKSAPQLRYRASSGSVLTAFVLGTGKQTVQPVSIHALETGIAIQMEGRESRDLLLLATHDEPIRVNTEMFCGQANALWLTGVREKPGLLRCLDYQKTENNGETLEGRASSSRCTPMFPARNNDDDSVGKPEMESNEPKNLLVSFAGAKW